MITVLYFAAAREAAGRDQEQLPFQARTIGELRRELVERHPPLGPILARSRLALQAELVTDDAPVIDGAEVAVIPPVSGGAGLFRVVEQPLSLSEVVEAVRNTDRGAVVTFTGEVRATSHGKKVLRLEYEAYRPMAEGKLTALGRSIEEEFGVSAAIVHRVGVLVPGEAAVIIACAAPHRKAAFRACEATIERLKEEAPIWKKEIYEDGAAWIGMGP